MLPSAASVNPVPRMVHISGVMVIVFSIQSTPPTSPVAYVSRARTVRISASKSPMAFSARSNAAYDAHSDRS